MCECPSMYSEIIRVARKPHRCCECQRQIFAGEKYQAASGMWDGSFSTFRTCIECADTRVDASEGARAGDCCELPCFGELLDYVSNGLPETAALVATMKTRIELGKPSSEDV